MKNADYFILHLRFSQPYAQRMLMNLHYIIWGSHSHMFEECWWLYTTLFEVLTAMCMKNADDFTLYNLRFSQPCGWRMEINLHYKIGCSQPCVCRMLMTLHYIIWGCHRWNVRLCRLVQLKSTEGDCCFMKWAQKFVLKSC